MKKNSSNSDCQPQTKKVKVEDGKAFQSKITCFFRLPSSELFPKTRLQLGDGKLPDKTIKIVSWNINGIKAVMNRGDLPCFINKADPDILCMNETKITESDVEKEKSLETLRKLGYYTYYNSHKTKGYCGVGILTKYKPISVKIGIGNSLHDNEARVITLEFEKIQSNLCIFSES